MKYITIEDLGNLAITRSYLDGIPGDRVDAQIEAASRKVDSYIGSQYGLPLTTVGMEVKEATAVIAAYHLAVTEGFNPEGPDSNYQLRYDDTIAWLKRVGDGKASLPGTVGADATAGSGQSPGARPMVITSSQRGFSERGLTSSGSPFVGD